MKNYIILLFALLTVSTGIAQTVENRPLAYCVRYEKAHLFLQKDSGFNVVDYDIEWPQFIDFDDAVSLKQAISYSMTGIASADLDSALSNVNIVYGNPVKEQFKTIPDDNRFCYITANAKIVGYQKGHWIAYYLEDKVEPQKLSEFKASRHNRIIVYDISRDKLLMANQLVNPGVTARAEDQDFYDILFSPLPDDFFNNMVSCQIDGIWIDKAYLYFLMTAQTPEQQFTYTSRLPLNDYYYALSREGRRVFLKDAKPKEPRTITAPTTWHGDSIYNNVEKMPEFRGGIDGLKQYLSHITAPETLSGKSTKAITSFVVDKDGNVQDVSIISPCSPEIDRHAVSVIKGMPKFTPGEHNGKKVSVRMYMPITYK